MHFGWIKWRRKTLGIHSSSSVCHPMPFHSLHLAHIIIIIESMLMSYEFIFSRRFASHAGINIGTEMISHFNFRLPSSSSCRVRTHIEMYFCFLSCAKVTDQNLCEHFSAVSTMSARCFCFCITSLFYGTVHKWIYKSHLCKFLSYASATSEYIYISTRLVGSASNKYVSLVRRVWDWECL